MTRDGVEAAVSKTLSGPGSGSSMVLVSETGSADYVSEIRFTTDAPRKRSPRQSF